MLLGTLPAGQKALGLLEPEDGLEIGGVPSDHLHTTSRGANFPLSPPALPAPSSPKETIDLRDSLSPERLSMLERTAEGSRRDERVVLVTC